NPRHVRRRNHNRIRLLTFLDLTRKIPTIFPARIPLGLRLSRFVCLGHAFRCHNLNQVKLPNTARTSSCQVNIQSSKEKPVTYPPAPSPASPSQPPPIPLPQTHDHSASPPRTSCPSHTPTRNP